MDYLKNTALILTIVGALNWGLVGFFDFKRKVSPPLGYPLFQNGKGRMKTLGKGVSNSMSFFLMG